MTHRARTLAPLEKANKQSRVGEGVPECGIEVGNWRERVFGSSFCQYVELVEEVTEMAGIQGQKEMARWFRSP
jgi:hypothetical protein